MAQSYPNLRRAQRAGDPYRRTPVDATGTSASFLLKAAAWWVIVGLITFAVAALAYMPKDRPAAALADRAAVEESRTFAGCNEARAAGAAPIYRGQPGYRTDMDGDNDGIACEPHG